MAMAEPSAMDASASWITPHGNVRADTGMRETIAIQSRRSDLPLNSMDGC